MIRFFPLLGLLFIVVVIIIAVANVERTVVVNSPPVSDAELKAMETARDCRMIGQLLPGADLSVTFNCPPPPKLR